MKLYVLIGVWTFDEGVEWEEQRHLAGVFSTREKAEEGKDAFNKKHHHEPHDLFRPNKFDIQEVELDEVF